jgi:hypothetical protein
VLDHLSGWLREQRLARGWSMAEMGRQLQQAARTSKDHTVPPTAVLTSYVRRWKRAVIDWTRRTSCAPGPVSIATSAQGA